MEGFYLRMAYPYLDPFWVEQLFLCRYVEWFLFIYLFTFTYMCTTYLIHISTGLAKMLLRLSPNKNHGDMFSSIYQNSRAFVEASQYFSMEIKNLSFNEDSIFVSLPLRLFPCSDGIGVCRRPLNQF
jgi:hypothetical protein